VAALWQAERAVDRLWEGRSNMRRRGFITLLSGTAASWPFAVRAQQGQRVRRLGVLWPGASAPAPPRLESFREGLREAGYIEGYNLTIELRYSRRGAHISRSWSLYASMWR
jgi:hypothetical protein